MAALACLAVAKGPAPGDNRRCDGWSRVEDGRRASDPREVVPASPGWACSLSVEAMPCRPHREYIEEKQWLTLAEFTDVVAIAEVTPDPSPSILLPSWATASRVIGVVATLGDHPSILIVMTLAAMASRLKGNQPCARQGRNATGSGGADRGGGLSISRVAYSDVRSLLIGLAAAQP